jgi:hypothetical protein
MNPGHPPDVSVRGQKFRQLIPNLIAVLLGVVLIIISIVFLKLPASSNILSRLLGSFLIVTGLQVTFWAIGARTQLLGTATTVSAVKIESASDSAFKSFGSAVFKSGRIKYWLFYGGPRGLRLAAIVSLVVFIVGSIWWYISITKIEGISMSIFGTSLEETPQAYKGLEAFALSDLKEKIDPILEQAKISDSFVTHLNAFNAQLADNRPSPFELMVVHKQGKGLIGTFLTDNPPDDSKHGFLFVPTIMLPLPRDEGISDEEIKRVAQNDPEIHASAAVAQAICEFQYVPAFDSRAGSPDLSVKPVQAYLITRKGLIRICQSNVRQELTYYRQQFPSFTYFPSRSAYFWKTINSDSPADQAGIPVQQFFQNVTKPYVDLGGNGIVVTMSRRVTAPGLTASGIFLDFSVAPIASKSIVEKIQHLSGSAHRVICTNEEPRWICTDEVTGIEDQSLSSEVQNDAENTSEFFGKIQVIKNHSGVVKFTIPIGPPISELKNKAGKISSIERHVVMSCVINLAWLRWSNFLKAIMAGGGLLLFLFFVGALIADVGMKLKEQEKAFQMVGQLMAKAPIAYTRLDENHDIIDMNEAFARLLGFQTVEQCRNAIKGFKELLADEQSRTTYEEFEKIRPPRGYELHLRKPGQEEPISVQVFGADVPMPPATLGASRPTFGIIIPTIPMRDDLN